MRHTILSFTITLLAFAGTTHAQPDSLWSRTFGGGDSDGCHSIIQTADGGYVLAGYTQSFGAGYYDMWLVKIDADGDSLWSRTFGGEDLDKCYSVIQTADGGYALAGITHSFGAGDYDMWLVKTDADGDSLWSRTFGGRSADKCYSVIQTVDGDYALAGITGSFGAGWHDIWLVKTNVDGDSLWSRTFGGSEGDWCESIIQTEDGGNVLAGNTLSFGAGNYDMWLVKTDVDGDSLWSQTFGGREWDMCYSVIQTTDGGYVIAGGTRSFGAGCIDMWLIRTDAVGDSLWSRTFGGGKDEKFHSIIQTLDGDYTLAGNTRSFGAGGEDMYLVKTDADGDSLWSRTFGGEDSDWCNSIIQTTDGGYALGGGTYSFGGGWKDMWLVKTGPDPVSVPPESFIPLLPSSFVLYPAYPNPFNSTLHVDYSLPMTTDVELNVYDLWGRSVAELVSGRAQAGFHTATFDGSSLASGVYVLNYLAAGHTSRMKVVLVK